MPARVKLKAAIAAETKIVLPLHTCAPKPAWGQRQASCMCSLDCVRAGPICSHVDVARAPELL